MSARNGDKARFGRLRRQKILLRKRIREMRDAMENNKDSNSRVQVRRRNFADARTHWLKSVRLTFDKSRHPSYAPSPSCTLGSSMSRNTWRVSIRKKSHWAQIGAGQSLYLRHSEVFPAAEKPVIELPDLKAGPMKEKISALLLHQSTESQRLLKQALEGRSIKVNWLRNYEEALPLLSEADPPHLVFTEASLPDGNWADVVKLALEALKPVKVIVVSRLIDVKLYVQTIVGGAFDFIVPPMTRDELAHVLACAVESVLNLRRTQAMAAAG